MGTLYVVATPIGNLEDITLRAVRTLKEANLIACEDTRRTKILLDRIGVRVPLVSFHQHSQLQKLDWVIEQLTSGLSIALVTDAGTPGLNDPGGVLVAAAIAAGADVVPIPGPNAAVTLLSVSGIPADRYLFLGYLPKKKGRQTMFGNLRAIITDWELPIVFYESPERIDRTMTDLHVSLGDLPVIIGRELTKQFEEVWRGTLGRAAEYWQATRARGEFVVIVTPAKMKTPASSETGGDE